MRLARMMLWLDEAATRRKKVLYHSITPWVAQFRAPSKPREVCNEIRMKRTDLMSCISITCVCSSSKVKVKKTIDAYARAVRRLSEHFDCCPDQLTIDQREQYFSDLVKSHSWSTVKIDRNGLQFFWKHVLKQDWQWVNIVKAPKVRCLPDILTVNEIEQMIGATRKLRYRVFLVATYSMGLRLAEILALQVGDIDGQPTLLTLPLHNLRKIPVSSQEFYPNAIVVSPYNLAIKLEGGPEISIRNHHRKALTNCKAP
jgi:integrase